MSKDSDLQRSIEYFKKENPEFSEEFEKGYCNFKSGVRSRVDIAYWFEFIFGVASASILGSSFAQFLYLKFTKAPYLEWSIVFSPVCLFLLLFFLYNRIKKRKEREVNG
jgi:hypothetical protein